MKRLLWSLLFLTVTGQAQIHQAHASPACESAIDAASMTSVVPNGLLHAIAVVESGRPDPRSGTIQPWPWTIDVGGQGYYFPTKAAAISAVRTLMAAGISSIDVGCMQINLSYHPAAFRNLDQAFDPMANARYAAVFLTRLYDSSLDWTKAAGAYHSQTPTLAQPYQNAVLAHWQPIGASKRYKAITSWEDYGGPKSWEDFATGLKGHR